MCRADSPAAISGRPLCKDMTHAKFTTVLRTPASIPWAAIILRRMTTASLIAAGMLSRPSSGEGTRLRRFAAPWRSPIPGGEPVRRLSPTVPIQAAGRLVCGSIVIVIIVVGAQPTRLRVDRDLARPTVERSGRLDIFAFAGDDDVRPPVGLQLLRHLFGRHRMVSGNENRRRDLLRRDPQAGGADEHRTTDHANDESIHGFSPSWDIHRRSAAKRPAFNAELNARLHRSQIGDIATAASLPIDSTRLDVDFREMGEAVRLGPDAHLARPQKCLVADLNQGGSVERHLDRVAFDRERQRMPDSGSDLEIGAGALPANSIHHLVKT